jgi:UPF0755 protein
VSDWGPPPVPGARTEEERERDRLEREARRSGRPRTYADGRGPRPRRSHRRAGLPVLIVLGLLAAGVIWFLMSLFQPFKGEGGNQVRVVVPKGASLGEISNLLEQRGVIESSFFFELRARLGGHRSDLRSGAYSLRQNAPYGELLDKLAAGPAADVLNVTVPEGRSRGEIAPIVRKAGLDGSYERASVRSPLIDPADYGAERARNLEGFLFPSTYELKRRASARTLVREQLGVFKREFRKVDMRFAKRKNLTEYDVLIIASMVEREAQLPKERPLVASVIYNRLHEGMPLGIDATIRYHERNWTRPLRQSELTDDNPYNTRLNNGLPPGPIGNPGLSSIKAAAHPARSRYLFYVVKPGTCGEHTFAKTDAEFQRAVERYNREREKRGGRSPTKC